MRTPRAALAASLLAAVVAGGAAAEERAGSIQDLLVDLAPKEFSAIDLHGERVALSDFRGKVVIVNFWGIWCPPCRLEIPELVELYRALEPQGLEILAVNTGDAPRRLPSFVEEHEMTFPVLLDAGASDLYEVVAYPTSYVFDRSGRIRYMAEGYNPRTAQELRRVVEYLLGEEG